MDATANENDVTAVTAGNGGHADRKLRSVATIADDRPVRVIELTAPPDDEGNERKFKFDVHGIIGYRQDNEGYYTTVFYAPETNQSKRDRKVWRRRVAAYNRMKRDHPNMKIDPRFSLAEPSPMYMDNSVARKYTVQESIHVIACMIANELVVETISGGHGFTLEDINQMNGLLLPAVNGNDEPAYNKPPTA